jgi:hypothetical protein
MNPIGAHGFTSGLGSGLGGSGIGSGLGTGLGSSFLTTNPLQKSQSWKSDFSPLTQLNVPSPLASAFNVAENCQITFNAEASGEGTFSCVKGEKSDFQDWDFCNGFVVKKEEPKPVPKPEPIPEPPKPEPKPEVKPCAPIGFI